MPILPATDGSWVIDVDPEMIRCVVVVDFDNSSEFSSWPQRLGAHTVILSKSTLTPHFGIARFPGQLATWLILYTKIDSLQNVTNVVTMINDFRPHLILTHERNLQAFEFYCGSQDSVSSRVQSLENRASSVLTDWLGEQTDRPKAVMAPLDHRVTGNSLHKRMWNRCKDMPVGIGGNDAHEEDHYTGSQE